MTNVSASEILQLLVNGKKVRDAVVVEPIILDPLAKDSRCHYPITIVDSRLHSLDGVRIQFQEKVSLKNTVIENAGASFMFSYFLKGVDFEDCLFLDKTDFQCGVHNQPAYSFTLQNCIFKGFVNFFDCHFDGPVEVTGCRFEGGTNLLGNKLAPYRVTFALPPQIESNFGNLELNGE